VGGCREVLLARLRHPRGGWGEFTHLAVPPVCGELMLALPSVADWLVPG